MMKINANSSVYGVFGNPISHSLSPIMHNTAFSHIGYDAAYLAFKVENIADAVAGIRGMNIRGVSVTIPHKVSIMPFLDELDGMAEKIGAVNTVINQKGLLTGYNSDWLGAVKALSEKTEVRGKNTAVIGAGGAARAIGFGIKAKGGHVTITNRSADKGEKLAADIGAAFLPLPDFKGGKYEILINTTPLGMTPNTDGTPVHRKFLEKGMVVMDIVYNPLKTRFLREAEERGCVTADGVSMFVCQGAFQFELWTWETAPTEVMRKAVLEAL